MRYNLEIFVGPSSTGSFVVFDAIQFTSVSASNDLDNNTVLNKNMLIKSISPNPFNGRRASIVYQTLTREDITITIFNQLGQKIMQTKLPEHYKGIILSCGMQKTV